VTTGQALRRTASPYALLLVTGVMDVGVMTVVAIAAGTLVIARALAAG
jgi:hypothetical protein